MVKSYLRLPKVNGARVLSQGRNSFGNKEAVMGHVPQKYLSPLRLAHKEHLHLLSALGLSRSQSG